MHHHMHVFTLMIIAPCRCPSPLFLLGFVSLIYLLLLFFRCCGLCFSCHRQSVTHPHTCWQVRGCCACGRMQVWREFGKAICDNEKKICIDAGTKRADACDKWGACCALCFLCCLILIFSPRSSLHGVCVDRLLTPLYFSQRPSTSAAVPFTLVRICTRLRLFIVVSVSIPYTPLPRSLPKQLFAFFA